MTANSEIRVQEIKKLFNDCATWEERYQKMIAIGKELPAYPEEHRTDKNLIQGCQSQVWLHAKNTETGVILVGDSDALLVKGLVAVLLKVYSGLKAEEILQVPLTLLAELGFEKNLTPSRNNGLQSMIKQIRLYAFAFQMLKKH